MNAASREASTPRWGMVIDLNRCVGCQTCTVACKHANDTTPGVQWRKVIDIEHGRYPDVERLFLVVGCQHCAEPPCVPVCPTGATRQREDGLVTMNYDACIGCAYCAVSCPYQARTIVHEQKGYFASGLTAQERAIEHPERRGVAQKCTFCQDRVDSGRQKGLTPGVHPEATPACANACISQAIQFGDFNDEFSHVSQLLKERPSLQLNAAAGTDPQIRYLYTTPAVPGRDAADALTDEERSIDPANPEVGPLQTFWDWRAAMNWAFGGVGSGFAAVLGLTSMLGLAVPNLPIALAAAAGLMAVGLFFVFLKIGRQMRFWRAFFRPQSSWMSRELYAVCVFFPAVGANLLWPSPWLGALAGVAALGFLACQAKILHRARGIPAWRAAPIPWLVFAGGLLEGCALATLWLAVAGQDNRAFAWAGVALAAAGFAAWRHYLSGRVQSDIPPLSRRVLASATPLVHGLAHVAPALLLLTEALLPDAAGALPALAAASAIAGGFLWKYTVIVRAGYQQGFSLPRVPQRGSGSRAAPARLGMPGAA